MTPEDSIKIQQNLGSDIVMAFDECTDYPATYQEAQKSMELSIRWAKRCKESHESDSALFGIVQGGMYKDLREESLNKIIEIDFDGIALGGLSVGESKEEKTEILQFNVRQVAKRKSQDILWVLELQKILLKLSDTELICLIAFCQQEMQEMDNYLLLRE